MARAIVMRLVPLFVLVGLITPARADGAVTVTGRLAAVWEDPLVAGGEPRLHLSVVDDQGSHTPIRAGKALRSRIAERAGERVTLSGTRTSTGAIRVTSAEAGSTAAPQLGSKPWRTLLCRFNGDASMPKTVSYFDGILGGTSPGMNHFWQSLSYGAMNINGSTTHDWLPLPNSEATYFSGGMTTSALFTLAQDCINAHDAGVSFAGVFGVNIIVNSDFCACAIGGSGSLSVDGAFRALGVTWEGPIGFSHQAVFGQEMGHAYGINWHSSGTGGTDLDPYVSKWDVMSNAGGVVTGECAVSDPTYGCVAQGTIAFHKDVLGWLPADRKYLSTGATQTITLHPIDALPATGGYLGAFVSIGGSPSTFYTVEVRRQAGYDAAIPDPSTVIIHKVNTALFERVAQVVDATPGTGTANDEDVRWDAGESFFDGPQGIAVKVLSGPAPDGSYQVEITGPAFPGAAPPLEITAKTLKIKEGDGRVKKAKLAVNLSAPAAQPVTFDVKTKNGSAKARKDYGKLTGTTGFNAGQTRITLPLRIAADSLDERNESFFVIFSNAAGAILAKTKVKIVIRDDD